MYLIATLQFPTGSYDAQCRSQNAEWPPSPERILAAGMANQKQHVIEKLYDLDPPTIYAQNIDPAQGRDGSYKRYVPRQSYGYDMGKIDKDPGDNTGVLVDPSIPVTVMWDIDNTNVSNDIGAIREAFLATPYLGRPTSPVIISATISNDMPEPLDGQDIYRPDPTGDVKISTPSPEVLQQRDRNYQIAVAQGAHLAPPAPIRRQWTRYARLNTSREMSLGNRRGISKFLTGATWYDVPINTPATEFYPIGGTLRTHGATEIQPGFLDGYLIGIAAFGIADPIPAQLNSGQRITLEPLASRPPKVISSLDRTVATATTWTTEIPVDLHASQIREELEKFSFDVTDALTHEESLGNSMLLVRPTLNSTHITIVLADPTPGPVHMFGQSLTAIE